MRSKLILLTCIVSLFYQLAYTEPMFIYFHEMIKESKLIAKGVYLGHDGNNVNESSHYYFLSKEVIKGKIVSDTLILNRAHGSVYLEPGKEYIAFINRDNAFEWVGIDKTGKKITNESLLFLEGFYDYNAYLVSPGVISYAQLKEYIVNATFNGSVYGDVHFYNMKEHTMLPSNIHFEIKYSFTSGKLTSTVELQGLDLNDFKSSPQFSLPCWNDIVNVTFEPNLVRPLSFNGKLNNLHPSAHRFRATFWVIEPEELSEVEFFNYVADTRHGPGYFELELKLENNNTYLIKLNEEHGRSGKLINYNGNTLDIAAYGTAPVRYITFGYPDNQFKMMMDSCKIEDSAFEFSENDLITELKHGPITGDWISLKNKQPVVRCTLSYKTTRFTKNENYGK